jgi:2-oxoglutarate ferredoxin oxidoreductase subunit beta
MIEYFKKNSVTLERAKNMSAEELKDKIVIGEFHVEDKPTFHDRYEKLVETISRKE